MNSSRIFLSCTEIGTHPVPPRTSFLGLGMRHTWVMRILQQTVLRLNSCIYTSFVLRLVPLQALFWEGGSISRFWTSGLRCVKHAAVFDSDHVWSWFCVEEYLLGIFGCGFGLEFVTQSTDTLCEFSRILSPVLTSCWEFEVPIRTSSTNMFFKLKAWVFGFDMMWHGFGTAMHSLKIDFEARVPCKVHCCHLLPSPRRRAQGFQCIQVLPRKEGIYDHTFYGIYIYTHIYI